MIPLNRHCVVVSISTESFLPSVWIFFIFYCVLDTSGVSNSSRKRQLIAESHFQIFKYRCHGNETPVLVFDHAVRDLAHFLHKKSHTDKFCLVCL